MRGYKRIMERLFIGLLLLYGGIPIHAAPQSDNLKAYSSVLDYAVRFMSGELDEIPDELSGIHELKNYGRDEGTGESESFSWAEIRGAIGYAFIDLDGNGTDELLITEHNEYREENSEDGSVSMIYALYNLVDGKPNPLLAGSIRNRWYLTKQHELVNIGTESAACSIVAVYTLVNNRLNCRDNWFTGISSDDDPLFYHSKEASIDPDKAQRLEWDFDHFNQNRYEVAKDAFSPLSKPFSDFRPVTTHQDDTATAAPQDNTDNIAIQQGYTSVLEEIVYYLSGIQTGEAKGFDAIDGMINELHLLNESMSTEQIRDEIGYAFRDLDNNGIPELLIGKMKPYVDYQGTQSGTSLLVLYNMKEGKPALLTYSLEFCLWFLTDRNQLLQYRLIAGFNENTCLFDFRNNEMQCRDRWYTDDNESYYHATSYDDDGTLLDWTDDDFRRNDKKLQKQTVVLPLTPFSTLRPVTVRQEGNTPYFATTTEVKDFQVVALSDVDYTDDGLQYQSKVLQSYPVLKPGEKIKAPIPTGSTMPEYAIFYTDPLGHTVKMGITESGIDGSIVLYNL